jgi:mono/diheme cytochrome c family protein
MRVNLWIAAMLVVTVCAGCGHRSASAPALQAKAAGTAMVVVSGDKQMGSPGSRLPQPLVLQVNDDQGNAVTGAKVELTGSSGVVFDPAQVLTDDSGQATFKVTLGGISGRYELTAASADAHGKVFNIAVAEYAAGYQQEVGYEVNEKYCSRCHDSESTVEQVSNYDNLAVPPHAFGNGDIYNRLSDSDLATMISHGGPAINRSALMPPYGWTLDKAETQAVIAYIRLVSEPPYTAPGVVYEKH